MVVNTNITNDSTHFSIVGSNLNLILFDNLRAKNYTLMVVSGVQIISTKKKKIVNVI